MDFKFSFKKIKQERSLGETFKRTRKRKKYSLEQVEKETKVSMKYLRALELGDFKILPAELYVKGFIRRYAMFLGLDAEKMIEKYHNELKIYKHYGIFKIEQKQNQENIIKPQIGKKWLKKPGFVVTPKLIVGAAILLMTVGILSYIFYQVRGFAAAPPLDIYEPSTEQVVKTEKIIAKGKTDPGAQVSINSEAVAIDIDGNFSQEIKLEQGVNNINIISTNKNGKITKRVLKVSAELPTVSPSPTPTGASDKQ